MPEWICLPRAINLGARNKVGMPQLRKALTAAGFDDVRTYMQSGNIVATSRHRSAAAVAEAVRTVVREEFGVDTPVLVRTPQQIRAILAWCPFPEDAAERPTAVQVVHLDAEPDPARVSAIMAEDWSRTGWPSAEWRCASATPPEPIQAGCSMPRCSSGSASAARRGTGAPSSRSKACRPARQPASRSTAGR